ncbi:nucleotide-sugar transporter [Pilobolus umbonatus]|nr:nucleotide-sugar transporter [Pilobolus umbonatus]
MGIALVVLPQDKETDTKTIDKSIGNQFNMKGLVSVIIACILSGVAGVYFEKIIKTNKQKGTGPDTNLPLNSDQSGALQLWVRNVQLCFFSVILGVFVMGLQDGPVILNHGFFQNYSGWTWIVIIIQALGGLIVALVVKYADNILKGFATCISIILSSTVSFFLFHFTVHPTFIMGALLVIYATYLYTS